MGLTWDGMADQLDQIASEEEDEAHAMEIRSGRVPPETERTVQRQMRELDYPQRARELQQSTEATRRSIDREGAAERTRRSLSSLPMKAGRTPPLHEPPTASYAGGLPRVGDIVTGPGGKKVQVTRLEQRSGRYWVKGFSGDQVLEFPLK